MENWRILSLAALQFLCSMCSWHVPLWTTIGLKVMFSPDRLEVSTLLVYQLDPSSMSSYSWVSRGLLPKTKWRGVWERNGSQAQKRHGVNLNLVKASLYSAKLLVFIQKDQRGNNPYAEVQGGAVVIFLDDYRGGMIFKSTSCGYDICCLHQSGLDSSCGNCWWPSSGLSQLGEGVQLEQSVGDLCLDLVSLGRRSSFMS
jgi:hypothetical protein